MRQATDTEEDQTSRVAEEAWRRPLVWRVIGSLAIMGFMLGMMLGQILQPDDSRLLAVEVQPDGLQLIFDHRPRIEETQYEGSVSLLIRALGESTQGQLRLGEGLVNWRLRQPGRSPIEPRMTLGFVAARPLRMDWQGQDVEGQWQLRVKIAWEFPELVQK